jgi:LAS superfamily LD-carboxypeptidase LdcB
LGIEAVSSRIAQIQSRMIAMQTQQVTAPKQASSSTSTTSATSGSGTAFATALADAMGTQPSAGTAKSYSLNGKGIPTELAGYGNGKIPASALEKVGGTGHKLWAPAAESLTRMISDAKAQGVTIGITDSYRSYGEQVDVARRKGLYSQGGLAAKPGTSEHGWGMATDLDLNNKAQAWVRANGEKYGFVENTPREPWHWAFKPKSL